jgi:hypothetical protein
MCRGHRCRGLKTLRPWMTALARTLLVHTCTCRAQLQVVPARSARRCHTLDGAQLRLPVHTAPPMLPLDACSAECSVRNTCHLR